MSTNQSREEHLANIARLKETLHKQEVDAENKRIEKDRAEEQARQSPGYIDNGLNDHAGMTSQGSEVRDRDEELARQKQFENAAFAKKDHDQKADLAARDHVDTKAEQKKEATDSLDQKPTKEYVADLKERMQKSTQEKVEEKAQDQKTDLKREQATNQADQKKSSASESMDQKPSAEYIADMKARLQQNAKEKVEEKATEKSEKKADQSEKEKAETKAAPSSRLQQQEAASNAMADKLEKSNIKKGEANVKNGLTEGVPERSKEMAERVDKKIDLDRSIREEAQKTQQQEKKKDQDLGL